MADPINAAIKMVAAATTQAYDYGSKVKHAKEDIENINHELAQVGQLLEKLKVLVETTERSGRSLDAWPTLIALKADDGPLAKCCNSLLELKAELLRALEFERDCLRRQSGLRGKNGSRGLFK